MRRALIIFLSALALLALLVRAWTLLPNSLFYGGGRPTPLGRRVNRAMAAWYGTGLTPGLMSTLEVRRRRSGELERQPVVIADVDGTEYLVSMLGERAQWVKNVRAAHGPAVLRHGTARRVRLHEVPVEERAPVLQAYLRRAFGARPHIPVPYDAPLAEFERIAASYPVFRIADEP